MNDNKTQKIRKGRRNSRNSRKVGGGAGAGFSVGSGDVGRSRRHINILGCKRQGKGSGSIVQQEKSGGRKSHITHSLVCYSCPVRRRWRLYTDTAHNKHVGHCKSRRIREEEEEEEPIAATGPSAAAQM